MEVTWHYPPPEPGTIQFEKRGILVKESCGDADISIVRQNGADGNISVKWKTIDRTAINKKDYQGGEGVIEFNHGEVLQLPTASSQIVSIFFPPQTHRTLHIPIVNDMEFEKDENFEIELFDAEGGAKIGKVNRTAVTITNDDGNH